jgi:hypothetical protein
MALQGNGATGWVVPNFGIEAELSPEYTIFCWSRFALNSGNAALAWGGAPFVHSAIYSTNGPNGYFFDDVDNAFDDVGATVFANQGTWTPLLVSKTSQSAATLYAGSIANSGGLSGALGAQTLTALYFGQDETGGGVLATNEGLAEVAIWTGPLGPTETAALMSGANPLTIQPGRILCYFPLLSDLRDYGPRGLSASGVAPKFTDHPPVASYLDALQPDGFGPTLMPVTGTLVATGQSGTLTAVGGPIVKGTLSATGANGTLVAVASNGGVRTASLVATGANGTLTATGKVAVGATLTATGQNGTLVATGNVTVPLTSLNSVISVDSITAQITDTTFGVAGTYTLYPSLLFADDSGGNYAPITNVAPLGSVPFNFAHPGMPSGHHVLIVSDPITTDAGTANYLVDPAGNVIAVSPFPPAGPALSGIIPAYLYEEYHDDADCQAFVDAYNGMAQSYLNWFNTLNLPIYTGAPIAGGLLDWVAQGLYGISRPVITFTQTGPSIGPFDTYPPDTIAMNVGTSTGTTQIFNVTDDIFKRIITWNFYKGDGKIFNIRWLKRRIARFLAGVNGTDYTGETYQISVSFTGANIVNVKITSGSLETTYGPLLQAALLAGTLPLPFQYTYNITLS